MQAHLRGTGLPQSPFSLNDYFTNGYWPNRGKNNPTNPQMGAWYGGDPAKSDPWGDFAKNFDLGKWLRDYGYNSLNNFSQPKMGWYGMGGTPNGGNVFNGFPQSQGNWWDYFTKGF